MISIQNVGSASKGVHYFSKDDYHSQGGEGEHALWYGKGAEKQGLSGPITQQAFRDCLEGRVGGQLLGKWVRNPNTGETVRDHRPATDMTFSAPKSVSILAEIGGDAEVGRAHDAAVKAAIRYVEQELAQTRVYENGRTSHVRTDNLTVALFRHNVSRDLDPQTHTHAVISNMTKRDDGAWRSLSNEELFKAQLTVGAVYNAELAANLQRQGYRLRRVDDKGNFEIEGITREQIEVFSQRRGKIVAALDAKGVDIADASAKQKEQATLRTRAPKTNVNAIETLAVWGERARKAGIDFDGLRRGAALAREALPLQALENAPPVAQGDLRVSTAARKAIEYAVEHRIERETVMEKQDLLKEALSFTVARESYGERICAGLAEIETAFDALQREGRVQELGDGNYTTNKMRNSESRTLDTIQKAKGQMSSMLDEASVLAGIHARERQQGFSLTHDQRQAVTMALTTNDRFVAIQGLAGTGKTTMLRSLSSLAEDNGYLVRGLAPTGMAAKALTQEAGIPSETVAMFQIKERQLQRDIRFAQKYAPDFTRRAELWVIDESSFLSQRQKSHLDTLAERADARVVYMGDIRQLQGVEAGRPFEQAQRHGIETASMTEINRQKTDKLKQAVDILTGRNDGNRTVSMSEMSPQALAQAAHRTLSYLDRAGMVKEAFDEETPNDEFAAIDALIKDYLSLTKAERNATLVITAYNKHREEINAGIRVGLVKNGEVSSSARSCEILVSEGWTKAMQKDIVNYRPGHVIRFGKDYRQIDASRDEYMTVISKNPKKLSLNLKKESGQIIEWHPHLHTKVEVYAVKGRALAQGDRIRMTRRQDPLKNGEVARVLRVEGTYATLEQNAERIKVDLRQCRHWDYAYAYTIHAAQGVTQHRTFIHVPVWEPKKENELADMRRVFGQRSFYVAVTRASHDLTVYTRSKSGALKVVSGIQDKTSATERGLGGPEADARGLASRGGKPDQKDI